MRNKDLAAAAVCGVLLAVSLMLSGCGATEEQKDSIGGNKGVSAQKASYETEETVLEKCDKGNPIIKLKDENGDIIYGGDPAVYVDGDTVYLYTGHDMSTDKEVDEKAYHIPEYLCYSSKDLINWEDHGSVLDMSDVSWAKDSKSAWASQVIKHGDKYYLYYCSWAKPANNRQSIGVAVSDSPTGPFEDTGEPLVNGIITKPQTSNWDDIDPTVWVETGDDGEEHRYLAWGNSLFHICELNEDMISVKDLNGDGEITYGFKPEQADILNRTMKLESFTEAPWIYRRQDESGKYYGDYYLFYASEWRESMAYSRTDDLLTGEWRDYKKFMTPTATCNTNHEAIFDFGGKTYMMYHNGALSGGNGYRRSACLQELTFDEDGNVEEVTESAAGISGESVVMKTDDGKILSHEAFVSSSDDKDYPYTDIKVGSDLSDDDKDREWVIRSGKADESDESLVSIEADNKVGLYITAGEDESLILSQDTDASEDMAKAQSFKSLKLVEDAGNGVIFESVKYEGRYISAGDDGALKLSGIEDAGIFVIE